LLDLNMPRVSGFDVLREIRGTPRLQHVPVAVVTSSHSPADMAEATRLGASRYIRKPVDLHEFFAMVGTTVRGILAEAA
jgi:two-component system, response regulator